MNQGGVLAVTRRVVGGRIVVDMKKVLRARDSMRSSRCPADLERDRLDLGFRGKSLQFGSVLSGLKIELVDPKWSDRISQ